MSKKSAAGFIKQFVMILVISNMVGVVMASSSADQPLSLQVKYSASTDPYFKIRDEYFIELLKLAITKSTVEINLIPIDMPDQVESRDVINLNKKVIDIHWMHTSNELESKLIPIRIPLDKGLFGWRLILLGKSNQHLLKDVRDLPDLKKYTFLQGYDWPDTAILAANGFKMETSPTSFRHIFRMLQRKRTDVFPRSVLEIWGEMEDQKNVVALDPYILLYYPTAYYFFVAKNNKELSKAIEYGLEVAVRDGSFEELFQRYHAGIIQKIDIENRRVIMMGNPILPPLTPVNRKELWLSPENIK